MDFFKDFRCVGGWTSKIDYRIASKAPIVIWCSFLFSTMGENFQLYNHGRAQAKEWLSGGRVASTFDSRQVAPATGRHCADVKNE